MRSRSTLPLEDPVRCAAVRRVLASAPEAARLEAVVGAARVTADADGAWLVAVEGNGQVVLATDGRAPAPAGARIVEQHGPAAEAVVAGAPQASADATVHAFPVLDREGHAVAALCVKRAGAGLGVAAPAAFEGFAAWAGAELALAIERADRSGAEDRSRDVIEGGTDLVLDVDPAGTIVFANAAVREALGDVPPVVAPLVAPSHAEAWRAALARAAGGAAVEGLEVACTLPDGRRAVLRGRLVPVARPGRPPIVRALLRDVTAERRSGAENARLLATLEATTDVVALTDVRGRISWLNAAGKRLLGLRADAPVRDLSLAELFGEAAWERMQADAIPSALRDGTWSGETELRSADGATLPASQVLVAHPSPRGGVWFLSTMLRDISEQKRRERAVLESEGRFRRLSDASRDGVVIVEEGRIVEANAAFERLFGYTADEARGLMVALLWATGERERVARYLASGIDGPLAVEGVTRERMPLDLEIAASSVTREGRRALVLLLRDVSGPKAVERMKRDFVTIVSHELRTPLTSIRGALGLSEELLARGETAQVRRLLRIATDNADRLTRLVGDVLDVEKLAAGRLMMAVGLVPVAEVVEAAVEGIRPMATRLDVRVRVGAVTADVILADRDRLLQVLTNFLSNAIRFSPAGAEVVASVRAVDGGLVRFAVEDRGPGIPLEEQPKLFERFSQLSTAPRARVQGGTGLGLAISRAIVEQHGGRIGVDSTPGVSTVFWCDLPIVGTPLPEATA
jgi:PAS domain S-box-containing protein